MPKKGENEPSKVDERGRTILPAAARKALGLTKGGFVVFEVKGDDVRVHRVEWTKPKRPAA